MLRYSWSWIKISLFLDRLCCFKLQLFIQINLDIFVSSSCRKTCLRSLPWKKGKSLQNTYCPWEETAVVMSPPGRTVQTQAGFLLLMITQKISSPVPSQAPHVPLHSVVILKQVSRHKLNASMNVGRDRHTDLFFLRVFSVHITEDLPTPVLTKTRPAILSVSHWCTSRLAAAISPRSFWRAILLFVKWLWIISQSEWSNRH